MQYININQNSIVIMYRFHCRVWSVFWTNQTKKKKASTKKLHPGWTPNDRWTMAAVPGDFWGTATWSLAAGMGWWTWENFRIYWDFWGFLQDFYRILWDVNGNSTAFYFEIFNRMFIGFQWISSDFVRFWDFWWGLWDFDGFTGISASMCVFCWGLIIDKWRLMG